MNVFGFSFSVFAEDGPWGFAAMVVSIFVVVGALFLLPATQTGESVAQVVSAAKVSPKAGGDAPAKKSNIFDFCWPASIFGCDSDDGGIEDMPAVSAPPADRVVAVPAAPLRNPVAVAAAAGAQHRSANAPTSSVTSQRGRARQQSARAPYRRGGPDFRATPLPQVGPNRFAATCRTVSKRQYAGNGGQLCTETIYQCGRKTAQQTSKFCL